VSTVNQGGDKRAKDIQATIDRLKNNEFIAPQTFEEFLGRKKGGKRMYFVNKPTREHATELMHEYSA